MNWVLMIVYFSTYKLIHSLREIHPHYKKFPASDVGKPLYLTSYIEAGKIEEGQTASIALLPDTNVTSHAGFFTVNKTSNSNLFFWFFPAEENSTNSPIILWLQGGPGLTSLFGLFNENGPFYIDKKGKLQSRQHYWSKVCNVIYIDNPVGTGFSFTDDDFGYVKDEISVGSDLFSAVSQFLELFPLLKKNDLFVFGESYAGKYAPAVAYTIHKNNEKKISNINLKGIAIGNGFTDPENMMLYGDYLYQIGLIDDNVRKIFNAKQDEILKNIHSKNFLKAYEEFHYLIAGDSDSFFLNQTGFSQHYNYLYNKESSPYGDLKEYVQSSTTRKHLHVGNRPFQNGELVLHYLKNDYMQSVKPWVENLLEHYRVLFFNGQLDIICAYPLTANFLQKFEWSGADLYKSAQRRLWIVDNELAGFSKSAKGLTEVLVRNAGHMVPTDQPKWALDLITRFIFNLPF